MSSTSTAFFYDFSCVGKAVQGQYIGSEWHWTLIDLVLYAFTISIPLTFSREIGVWTELGFNFKDAGEVLYKHDGDSKNFYIIF